ncbi:hypothetical protein S83_035706, partial [Arachis hypogaea]
EEVLLFCYPPTAVVMDHSSYLSNVSRLSKIYVPIKDNYKHCCRRLLSPAQPAHEQTDGTAVLRLPPPQHARHVSGRSCHLFGSSSHRRSVLPSGFRLRIDKPVTHTVPETSNWGNIYAAEMV